MKDLLSLFPEEIEEIMKELGEPAYRARQIFGHAKEGMPPAEMSSLPRALREKLSQLFEWRLPTVVDTLVSSFDGTTKYLFRLLDGECIESVLMRYRHGNTLCISSQVGCRMGCRFCASTIGGRVRDLLPSEMLGQVIAARRLSGERISNIVMMGIGEPLDNYDNVVRFLRLVNHPDGLNIGYRHISLSTCGLCDGIRRLAKEALPITLSVSLHAATDEARSALMPVNRRYPIAELMSAVCEYYAATGRRISFEYALVAGKNDTKEDAERLVALLRKTVGADGAPIHINLIRVNEVAETGLHGTSVKEAAAFAARLEKLGVTATVRRRLGSDVNAACGQLRRAHREREVVCFAASDRGQRRPRNEDRALSLPLSGGGQLVAVFDGMGGHASGDLAAELAKGAFCDTFRDVRLTTPHEGASLLQNAALLADSLIRSAARDVSHYGMGTTVTALLFFGGEVASLNVGDSRTYLLRGDVLYRMTKDDSYVQSLIDAGAILPEDAEMHPRRHVITRSLGALGDGELSVVLSPVKEKDRYLLCSDGLYTALGEKELKQYLKKDLPPEKAVGAMIARANEKGGEDNITAVLMQL